MSEEKKSKPSGYSILRKKLEKSEQDLDKMRQENASLAKVIEDLKNGGVNDWKKSYDSLKEAYDKYRTSIQNKINHLGFFGKMLWNRA